MYWDALSTRISEPGRKRPGFFFCAGGEDGISFADPVVGGGFRIFQHPCGEGGISFADPVEGGASEAETRRCFAPAFFRF